MDRLFVTRPTPRVRAGVVALVLAHSFTSPRAQESSPIDLDAARTAFANATERALADGGELWGRSLESPLIAVDRESRACVASAADAGGLLREIEGVWTGTFPSDAPVANFTTTWSGTRWTMVMWPLPTDSVACTRLLLHESFHFAQAALGISLADGNGECAHLETYEGRLWMRLEARALAHALESAEGTRDEAVLDALLFRARRRALFPNAAAEEDGLERTEGSAEYTGIRLSTDDAARRVHDAAELLRGLRRQPSLPRSFQYATGPGYGLLLDDYDPFWREAFLAGATLTELVSPAVLFESPPAARQEAVALERARAYGFGEVDAEERAREAERLARVREYRERFVDGPVLVLATGDAQRTFDPGRVERIPEVGTVYGALWASAAWGVFETESGALVLPDGTTHVGPPTDFDGSKLVGDGWTLELAPGWTVVAGERDGDLTLARE